MFSFCFAQFDSAVLAANAAYISALNSATTTAQRQAARQAYRAALNAAMQALDLCMAGVSDREVDQFTLCGEGSEQ